MSDEKKKKIGSALNKMESEFTVRAQENQKIRVIEKKQYKQEVEEEKKTKSEQETERKELSKFEFRSTTTQVALGLLISIIFVWNLSRSQRTTLVENFIIVFCVCGIVAAKKKL